MPAEDPPPLVELDDVTLRIGTTEVLDGLTVRIPDRGITVVLGPSGSGKSSMLRLINRLEVPTSGRVLFRGVDVADFDPLVLRRRVGMVFQQPTPFPGTVRDNLRIAAPGASDGVMARLLERCGLPPAFVDRDTEGLSGGEAQRVCLARALAVRPEVVLMDEPTASLDPEHRLVVEDLAVAFARDGLPVVWVTHDLDQADRLVAANPPGGDPDGGGHAVVLVDGRLASPAEAVAFREAAAAPPGEATGGEGRT